MENKSIVDLNIQDRTATLVLTTFNEVDPKGDISRPQMFDRTWKEDREDIFFYVNNDYNLVPGKPVDFWKDSRQAYTKVLFGKHSYGEDIMKMVDEGVIKNVDFGFIARSAQYTIVNNQRVRELLDVKQTQVSLITGSLPTARKSHTHAAMPYEYKAFQHTYATINDLREQIDAKQKFCYRSTATDECIESVWKEVRELKSALSQAEQEADDLELKDLERKLYNASLDMKKIKEDLISLKIISGIPSALLSKFITWQGNSIECKC